MTSIGFKGLLACGLFAGLMFATGHAGGGLAIAVAGASLAWMARGKAVRRDLR